MATWFWTYRTDYPWTETVTIEVHAAPKRKWEVSLRLPAWCQNPTMSLNGEPVEAEVRNGYATMTRHWGIGDAMELTLPMPAHLMAGHPFIESTRSAVAIVRGPIVYCIEACDQPRAAADATVSIDPKASLRSAWRPDVL